jgi:hypothetical protein
MSGSTTPCLFCGAVGVKLTNEHVYPRWLHRALNIQGDITYSSDRMPIRVVSEFDVQVREVCEVCNNGWLHDLERAFRAVMIWPMNGLGPIPLIKPVQHVVALWAVKTWLLMEQSMAYIRGDKTLEPQPHLFREIREKGAPPATAQVWIGAVDAMPDKLISFVATRWVGTPPNPPVGLFGVFTIGCVLFQVYMPVQWGSTQSQPFALGLGPSLTPFLTQIWPNQVEEVEWPPTGVFSADDLERVWPSGGHIDARTAPSG